MTGWSGAQLVDLRVDEQLAAFLRMVQCNEHLTAVLTGAQRLGLPAWYLTAGAVFQTVWNVLSGADPTAGIKDYDLFYFDDRDLGWDAEDVVIRRAATEFADLLIDVEVRNEARVHLWYEERFGVPCTPFASVEDAIRAFASTTCSYGLRLESDGEIVVYAPFGFADLFAMVVRPNPVLAPRHVYETKAARWVAQWPGLRVMSWPEYQSKDGT